MIRKIIHIDEEKCNGCGICATACHEGAIDTLTEQSCLLRQTVPPMPTRISTKNSFVVK